MKFNNIESVWAYAKKKCPQGVIISTVKKMSGGLKAFDINIPKSKVTKWPAGVKDEDLEFTISSDMSGLFIFLEANNTDQELIDASDFASMILSTMGLKESLNESDQTWFEIDNHNYDKYGIQSDAYQTMVRITGESSFMFTNRYNQQNEESISVGKLMKSVEGNKSIQSTFANTTIKIFTLKDGVLVVEPGQSKFEEKIYISNKVYQSLNVNESMNENAIIGVVDSFHKEWDKEISFTYYGTRADLDKQLSKLKKSYLLEVMPGDEAMLHCKNSDIIIFKGYLSALKESEHMQGTGKLFYTAEEVGVLSDDAIKVALETLSGQMSELSTDPAEESIKAYKDCENTYANLRTELSKRGLNDVL